MARFYPESDGGDTWMGHYMSRQSKTYYVVDELGERRECASWHGATQLATMLNDLHETGHYVPSLPHV